MRKILLARLSDCQRELATFTQNRNKLHPASEDAKKLSIQMFEYQAKISELTFLLNVSHEN